jgi:hypothetical protein
MKKFSLLFLTFLTLSLVSYAQLSPPEKLQTSVDSKSFVFEARQTSGVRGGMIQLDPGFTLLVSPDKVTGDLPFYGRSFTATPGSSDGGLKFEFSEFDYTVKLRKKGGWDITIEPTESNDIRSIYLTVQKTGNASLRITSNSKESMSYTGIIKE